VRGTESALALSSAARSATGRCVGGTIAILDGIHDSMAVR
jgi:hypothetical protein